MSFKITSQTWHQSRRRTVPPGQLVVLLALLIGLLNFPSASASGAEISHPHSLFMLAHHHHDHDGATDVESDRPNQTRSDDSAVVAPSMTDSAVLQQLGGDIAGGGPIGLTVAATFRDILGLTSMSPHYLAGPIPLGLLETPESPPPRI